MSKSWTPKDTGWFLLLLGALGHHAWTAHKAAKRAKLLAEYSDRAARAAEQAARAAEEG